MQPISSLLSGMQGGKGAESFGAMSPVERAVCWVRQNRLALGGIAVHHKSELATQEVTGYLIPSLLNAGDEALAEQLALWEASVQKPDGSFAAPDGVPYTFDTAQVIRGFLSVLEPHPWARRTRAACVRLRNAPYRCGREGHDRVPSKIGSWLTETF